MGSSEGEEAKPEAMDTQEVQKTTEPVVEEKKEADAVVEERKEAAAAAKGETKGEDSERHKEKAEEEQKQAAKKEKKDKYNRKRPAPQPPDQGRAPQRAKKAPEAPARKLDPKYATYEGTTRTPPEKSKTIRKYLSRQVAALPLPVLYQDDSSCCPLILDGASGVGKTQQAFALLKVIPLVYVLMTEEKRSDTVGGQIIYKEMRDFTEMGNGFTGEKNILKNAMTLAEEESNKRSNKSDKSDRSDPYSVDFIESITPALGDLCEFVKTRVLTQSQPSGELTMGTKCSPKGLVLFIDEVLPGGLFGQDFLESYQKLRFLRNFGRANEMHVVLAGTAALAANITIPKSIPIPESRHQAGLIAWAEIAFLDALQDMDGPGKVRPLVAAWLEDYQGYPGSTNSSDNQYNARGILRHLQGKLLSSKKSAFEDKKKFIWLSGAYLQTAVENVSTPFCVPPSELVRSHFFEPAVMLDGHNNVYLGRGIDKIHRAAGPMRLRVLKRDGMDHQSNPKLWWALLAKEGTELLTGRVAGEVEQVAAAVSTVFSNVEYALSHCVQQCLAREPILAAALSKMHAFSPSQFQSAIQATYPETMAQRTKGALDGQLNELVVFAALQQACRGQGQEFTTSSVRDFITTLEKYLNVENFENFAISPFFYDFKPEREPSHQRRRMDITLVPQKDGETARVTTTLEGRLKTANKAGKQDLITKLNDEIRQWNELTPEGSDGDKLDTETVPWLVPACSHEKIRDARQAHGENLFGDIDIAALIPGGVTSRTDASAVSWKSGEKKWLFEFRAQIDYSMDQAREDLIDKCGNARCHAMLIACSDKRHSVCQYWVMQANDKDFLRVVLLVGDKR